MDMLRRLIGIDNPFRLYYHKLRAILANILYGFPSKDMQIIGVTGTNGKTTTCNLIAQGLKEAGHTVFMFTTVNIIIGDEAFTNDSKMTSPDAFLLQKYFKQAREAGCTIAVIETASHGIKMHRIWGLDYDTCILTNITQDHLDLHKTMEDYVQTKLQIFKKLMYYKRKPGIKKVGILNTGSKYIEDFLDQTYDSLYKYGMSDNAQIRPINIKKEGKYTSFQVISAGTVIDIKTELKGDFNIENILAAVALFISFGIEGPDITKMIAAVPSVAGRMESVENTLGADIIVDYAHTEDALEKVLTNLREYKFGKIVVVFGATGSRDTDKRPKMGKILDRYADVIILTQDDDYAEITENIITDILPGIQREEGNDFWIIPTRREAIEAGISYLQKGDCLLVAGKGDEHTMVTNNGPVAWHDKTVIEDILREISENERV